MIDIQELVKSATRRYVLAAWRDLGITDPDEKQIEIMRDVLLKTAVETERDDFDD